MEKRLDARTICIDMLMLSQIINSKKGAELNFVEHLKIVELIEQNKEKNPDVSIETCKALVEGISKKILMFLDKSQNKKTIVKLNFPDLFRKTLDKILEFDSAFEVDFTERSCSIIGRLAQIRNDRGEISHGKSYPKDEESNPVLADLVIKTTEAVLTYVLHSFYSIDLTQHLPIAYEANPGFNSYLDELYSDIGIVYSKALYDQDYIQYNQSLIDYNSAEQE